MSLADEQTWVERAKQGDAVAFAELVRRHQSAVFNVAYRLLGQRRDAEDVTQETFLRAYRSLASFEAERPFAPWVKRIAANTAFNLLETERVHPTVLEADLGHGDEETADLDAFPSPNSPNPEQTMLAKEQELQVRREILRLSPRHRLVIELRHFQELSYEEIATLLKRPLSDIKSDLFRARKLLAQRLVTHEP